MLDRETGRQKIYRKLTKYLDFYNRLFICKFQHISRFSILSCTDCTQTVSLFGRKSPTIYSGYFFILFMIIYERRFFMFGKLQYNNHAFLGRQHFYVQQLPEI